MLCPYTTAAVGSEIGLGLERLPSIVVPLGMAKLTKNTLLDENKHEAFGYRPYRRGKLRCDECGGRFCETHLGTVWPDLLLLRALLPAMKAKFLMALSPR